MANDINQPKDFSWAGLAATTGIAGLGGFIFDRYIRGNKNLLQNLGMAAGFGAGGALASTAYQAISDKVRSAKNAKAEEQGSGTITDAAGGTQQLRDGKLVTGPKSNLGKNIKALEEDIRTNPIKSRLAAFLPEIFPAVDTVKAVKTVHTANKEALDKATEVIKENYVPELKDNTGVLPKPQGKDAVKRPVVTVTGGTKEIAKATERVEKLKTLEKKLSDLLARQDLSAKSRLKARVRRIKTGKDLKEARQQLSALQTPHSEVGPIGNTSTLTRANISPTKAQKMLNQGGGIIIDKAGRTVIDPAMRQNAVLRIGKDVGRYGWSVLKENLKPRNLALHAITLGMNKAVDAAHERKLAPFLMSLTGAD